MAEYVKQVWKDAFVDDTGNVIEAGTLITKERMEHIEDGVSEVNNSLSEVIKRDGSVQMTGVLKTVGGIGTVKQLDMGEKVACYSDGISFTIAMNAYYDNVNNKWKYVADGKAGIININPNFSERPIQSYYAEEGIKDGDIAPWIENTPLTNKTGLPLTGGTLSGTLNMPAGCIIRKQDTNTEGGELYLEKPVNSALPTNVTIDVVQNFFRVFSGATGIQTNLKAYPGTHEIYHEGNITVSQTAPTTTLPNGCMHNVY